MIIIMMMMIIIIIITTTTFSHSVHSPALALRTPSVSLLYPQPCAVWA